MSSGIFCLPRKDTHMKDIDEGKKLLDISEARCGDAKRTENLVHVNRDGERIKVLNLYAGVGGNRKLWENVEVTSVEKSKEIAEVYNEFYPDDTVVVGDAIEFLMKNYKNYDFFWVSPPCQSHSKVRFIGLSRKKGAYDPVLPDFTLYSLIVWFRYHCNDKLWCVENVRPYYKPPIEPTVQLDRHFFWSNFPIPPKKFQKPQVRHNYVRSNTVRYGIDIRDKKFKDTTKSIVTKNCVDPEIGDYIFRLGIKAQQNNKPCWG